MREETFRLPVGEGVELFVYRWEPEGLPRAVVQIAHGIAEHAGRYRATAEALTAAGYAVYAQDHRGHGRTAAVPGDLGYFADEGGWQRVVDDIYELRRRVGADHPDVPVFLLGHSMGSLLVQQYMFSHGAGLAGVVLSGTSTGAGILAAAGVLVARIERARLGPRGHSALVQALIFGDFNRRFAPVRTEYDWLSRDTAEVDKYVADPLCGFMASVLLWEDLLRALVRLERAANIERVPTELPVYIFSGALDPVGRRGHAVRFLANAYARAGLRDVQQRLYEGGRHEMLNEVNRDEVVRDLIAWLDGVLDRQSKA